MAKCCALRIFTDVLLAIFEADGAVIDNGQWAETAVSTPDDLLTQGTGPFYCLEPL